MTSQVILKDHIGQVINFYFNLTKCSLVKKCIKEFGLINTFLNQLETVFRKKLDEILDSISIRDKMDEKNEIFNYYEWIIVRLFQL